MAIRNAAAGADAVVAVARNAALLDLALALLGVLELDDELDVVPVRILGVQRHEARAVVGETARRIVRP